MRSSDKELQRRVTSKLARYTHRTPLGDSIPMGPIHDSDALRAHLVALARRLQIAHEKWSRRSNSITLEEIHDHIEPLVVSVVTAPCDSSGSAISRRIHLACLLRSPPILTPDFPGYDCKVKAWLTSIHLNPRLWASMKGRQYQSGGSGSKELPALAKLLDISLPWLLSNDPKSIPHELRFVADAVLAARSVMRWHHVHLRKTHDGMHYPDVLDSADVPAHRIMNHLLHYVDNNLLGSTSPSATGQVSLDDTVFQAIPYLHLISKLISAIQHEYLESRDNLRKSCTLPSAASIGPLKLPLHHSEAEVMIRTLEAASLFPESNPEALVCEYIAQRLRAQLSNKAKGTKPKRKPKR